MNRTVLVRLAALVVAIVVIVVVGVAAYHVGVDNSTAGPAFRVMPFRGRMMASGDGFGVGILWLAGVVVVGLLFVWLLAAILSPGRGGELSTLKDLSELHAQGRLTDEEFTAAKRKLLGLQ